MMVVVVVQKSWKDGQNWRQDNDNDDETQKKLLTFFAADSCLF